MEEMKELQELEEIEEMEESVKKYIQRLISYLKEKDWSAAEILDLIEFLVK